MFPVFEIKHRFELIWDDLAYIECPAFARTHTFDAVAGRSDPWGAQVLNIDEFKSNHALNCGADSYNPAVEQRLSFLFSTGNYFSVARNQIPFAANFKWRPLDDHPDGGEWYIWHYQYGDHVKHKLEAYAKHLGEKRRRMLAEAAEDSASVATLIPVVRRMVEKAASEKHEPGATNHLDDLADMADGRQSESLIGGMGMSKPLKCPTPEDIEIAKSIGCTPRHIEAREVVARDFLKNNEFTKDQIEDALGASDGSKKGGVDLSKPVEIITFPPPEKMDQYVKSHGYPGNWFDPLSTQTPEMLGISGETRTLKSFTVVPGRGLKSIANPVVDTWTNPKNPKATPGGGVQLLVNDETKSMISSINPKGI